MNDRSFGNVPHTLSAVLLFLLLFSPVFFSDSGSGTTPITPTSPGSPTPAIEAYPGLEHYLENGSICVACQQLHGASQAYITSQTDQNTKSINIISYYQNLSSNESRTPISNAILIVEASNATSSEVYKVYTDSTGHSTFNFSRYSNSGCYNFKVLYCPFCLGPDCGFSQCLAYAGINTNYTAAADIPAHPSNASAPTPIQQGNYLPAVSQVNYCAPPPPATGTPAICFPVILIFSLLAGALYLSGRNPFTGFNMAASKPGKHIRYQARGRGFSLNTMQAGFGVMGAVNAAKTIAKGGVAALRKQEGDAAKERGPIQQVHRATAGLKNVSVASKAAAAAKGKDGKALNSSQQRQVQARAMESLFATGSIGSTGATQTGRGMELLPSTGGGFRASELVGSNVGSTIGRVLLFVASQTTLGSLIGSIWYAAAGRSMFDSAFSNPEALATRRQKDLTALADIARVSDRVTIAGGREAQVMGVEVVDGNTRMNLRVSGQNGAEDTNFTVVVNSQGTVRQIEMRVQTTNLEGQTTAHVIIMRSPEGGSSGNSIWIRVPDPNHPGQTMPQQVPAACYYEQVRDARGNITEVPLAPPVAGDNRANSDRLNQLFNSISNVMPAISTSFGPGRSTEIVTDYNTRQAALNVARETVSTDFRTEMMERSRILGETVPHNIIDRAANDYAGRALVGLLHVNSTLGVSGSDPVATQQAMFGGREPAAVLGAITTAYNNSLGSDIFRSRLATLLGDRVDVDVVMGAMGHLSASTLGGTRASVRDALVEQILLEHPDLKNRANDIRTAFSERRDAANTAPAVDLVRNTATSYRNALVDASMPQAIIDGAANQSTMFVAEAVRVGREIDPSVRYTDSAGSILARTDQTQLPTEVRRQVDPFAILQHGVNTIETIAHPSSRPNEYAASVIAVSNACSAQNEVYAQANVIASDEGRSILGEKYNMTAEASHHLSYSTSVVASTGFAPREGQLEEATSREHEALETMRREVNENLRAGNFDAAMTSLQALAQRAQLLGDEHDSTIALNALGAVAAARERSDFNANDPANASSGTSAPTYADSQGARNVVDTRTRVAGDVAGQLAGLNEGELARRTLFNDHVVATENERIERMSHELNEGHTDNALAMLESWRSTHLDRCRLNGTPPEEMERSYESARDIILRSNRVGGQKVADTRAEDLAASLRQYDLRTTLTPEQIDTQTRMMGQIARMQAPPDGEDPPTDDQIRRRIVAAGSNYSASATATYHAADEYAGAGVMAITKGSGRRQ